jgi:hypothetical protein
LRQTGATERVGEMLCGTSRQLLQNACSMTPPPLLAKAMAEDALPLHFVAKDVAAADIRCARPVQPSGLVKCFAARRGGCCKTHAA